MENQFMNKQSRYSGLDGLRTYAAIFVLLMHVKANLGYEVPYYPFERLIDNMWRGVFLFMMISGFALCCGYYERILNNSINIVDFYKKRYKKILPFFALLVLLDVILGFSKEALIEGMMDLTLAYSLLPNPNISVIGVGWTLGVIFLFYILFPFFCFLIRNKRSSIYTLLVVIAINYFCSSYFMTEKFVISDYKSETNVLYCAVYFMIGGISYLYRNELINLIRRHKAFSCVIALGYSALYFTIVVLRLIRFSEFETTIMTSLLFWIILVMAIESTGKILNNKFTKYISSISFEIYLCHMVIFRAIEKVGILKLFGKGGISYLVVVLLTFIGAVGFSKLTHEMIAKVMARLSRTA